MRLSVVYGNGCTCTICHKVLVPKEAIKIKAHRLSDNPIEASTGTYITLGKMDLCNDCYLKIIKPYLEKPRKTK